MPIGTRLGFLYSWKLRSINNTKKQYRILFKREQQYNDVCAFLILVKDKLKNNPFLPGLCYTLL